MNMIEKFKQQPLPVKIGAGILATWIYPFIESVITGADGFYDLSIIAIILISIGLLGLLYSFIVFLLLPIGKWCLLKLGLIKKK